MNMMRRLICFLLVMVMTLSVACPALADSTGNSSPSSNPKTGDQIMMYVIIMVVALVALVAVLLFSRKFLKK